MPDIPTKVLHHPDLNGPAVRLYGLIAEIGGQPIARKVLARRLRCSVDTVDRAIRRLERAGLLEVERTTTRLGDPGVSRYQLTA